jgi:hypothetical protein
MKSMKVIHTKKNMMIQESQHCVEFQLSEVMNLKMQMIQFVSIVNLIQMKVIVFVVDLHNILWVRQESTEESIPEKTQYCWI